MKAIQLHQVGGPELLTFSEITAPEPGPGQVAVRLKAIGVNFIDIYHRIGLYKVPLPFTPGQEGSGLVEAIGEGVTEVKVGQRVAWAMHSGSYAECAVVPAWKLVPLPEEISFQVGAALMLQGMTAHYLACSTFALAPGDRALIHAAAGGVGLLLVQIAKQRGATVYATVGSAGKAEIAAKAGADATIIYTEEEFAARIDRITNGNGVQVVYDSVGQSTFQGSLKSLAPRGYLVSYGQSSGPLMPLDLQLLSSKGSLFVTRPSLAHYMLTRNELLMRAQDLFSWVSQGKLQVAIDSSFPLSQAAEAHRRLASRQSSGKLLLIP